MKSDANNVANSSWIIKRTGSIIQVLSGHKDLCILGISLAALTIMALIMYDDAYRWLVWKYDDAENLDVSYNLFHRGYLTKDFIDFGAHLQETNIPTLTQFDQISNPLRSKGPLYFVLLGGWLYVTGANYVDWYFWGSVFNLLLTASSIVLFYLFVKRHFGFEIAAYSTLVLALMPGLFYHAVRIRPEVLTLLLILSSLFFMAKKTPTLRDTVIAGVLVALAYLSHPLGLGAGAAVVIYLIYRHKIRASLIIICILIIVISPWAFRNLLIFGNAFEGFGVLLPTSLSETLGLISSNGIMNLGYYDAITELIEFDYPPFQILLDMQNEFVEFYGMQFFILIVPLSVFAYLDFKNIRRLLLSRNNLVILIGSILVYVLTVILILNLPNSNVKVLAQFVLIFLIPVTGYLYLRFFPRRTIFTNNGNYAYTLIVIVAFMGFVEYFIISIGFNKAAEVRFLYPFLFLLLPLSVVGLKKILDLLLFSINYSIRPKMLTLATVSVLFTFVLVTTTSGIATISSYEQRFAEKDYQTEMYSWIRNNIPEDASIATDLPHAVLLRTGREAVNMHWAYADNISYEYWLIKKFDIDYLVYHFPVRSGGGLYFTNFFDIKLDLVYAGMNGTNIYKVNLK